MGGLQPCTIIPCDGPWNSATQKLRNVETQKLRTQHSERITQKFGSSDALCPDSDRGRSVPPFGFDTVEMSSITNEDMSFLQRGFIVQGF